MKETPEPAKSPTILPSSTPSYELCKVKVSFTPEEMNEMVENLEEILLSQDDIPMREYRKIGISFTHLEKLSSFIKGILAVGHMDLICGDSELITMLERYRAGEEALLKFAREVNAKTQKVSAKSAKKSDSWLTFGEGELQKMSSIVEYILASRKSTNEPDKGCPNFSTQDLLIVQRLLKLLHQKGDAPKGLLLHGIVQRWKPENITLLKKFKAARERMQLTVPDSGAAGSGRKTGSSSQPATADEHSPRITHAELQTLKENLSQILQCKGRISRKTYSRIGITADTLQHLDTVCERFLNENRHMDEKSVGESDWAKLLKFKDSHRRFLDVIRDIKRAEEGRDKTAWDRLQPPIVMSKVGSSGEKGTSTKQGGAKDEAAKQAGTNQSDTEKPKLQSKRHASERSLQPSKVDISDGDSPKSKTSKQSSTATTSKGTSSKSGRAISSTPGSQKPSSASGTSSPQTASKRKASIQSTASKHPGKVPKTKNVTTEQLELMWESLPHIMENLDDITADVYTKTGLTKADIARIYRLISLVTVQCKDPEIYSREQMQLLFRFRPAQFRFLDCISTAAEDRAAKDAAKNQKDAVKDQERMEVIENQEGNDAVGDRTVRDAVEDKQGKDATEVQAEKDTGEDQIVKEVDEEKTGKDVGEDRAEKDATVCQGRKDTTVDEGGKDSTSDRGGMDTDGDGARKHAGEDQGGKDATVDAEGKDVTVDQRGENETISQEGKDTTADEGGKDVTVDQGGENKTVNEGGKVSTENQEGNDTTVDGGKDGAVDKEEKHAAVECGNTLHACMSAETPQTLDPATTACPHVSPTSSRPHLVAPTPARLLTAEEADSLARQDSRAPTAFVREKIDKEARKSWDKFYLRNQDRFFKDRHWTSREFAELCEISPSDSSPLTLLEVGCGVGNFLLPLMQENPNLRCYGCDFSERAVNILISDERYDSNRCSVFCADVTADRLCDHVLPSSTCVDIATMVFVLSAIHPTKMRFVLENVGQVLKTWGSVLIRFKAGTKLSENHYVRQDGTMSYFFSKESLCELFEEAGFRTSSCDYVHRRTVNRLCKLKHCSHSIHSLRFRKEGVDVKRVFVQGKFVKAS